MTNEKQHVIAALTQIDPDSHTSPPTKHFNHVAMQATLN